MSRPRKILLVIALALLLLPSIALLYVATTESGLRLIAGTLTRIGRIGPVELAIEDVSGTVAGGLQVGGLSLKHRAANLEISGASGRLRLLPLLARRIDIVDLRVGQVDIVMLSRPKEPPTRRPRFLAPTLRIDADDARIAGIALTAISGTRFEATDVQVTATVQSHQIRVREVQLKLSDLQLRAAGRVHARTPYGFEGRVEANYGPRNLPSWHVVADFDGDLDELPLTVNIEAPFDALIEGSAYTLNAGWRYAGAARIEDFDLAKFGGGNALGLIAGTLDIAADAQGFRARGPLAPTGLGTGPLDIDFEGRYQARRLTIRQASVTHAGSRSHVTTRGTVTMLEGGGQMLALEGQWSQFQWPLTAAPAAFVSPRGSYTLNGNKPWKVTAEGDLKPVDLPSMPFALTGELGTESFVIGSADVGLLRGRAQLAGEARWKPAEQWRVTGRATGIDPAALRPDLPGQLAFAFAADGAPFGGDAALNVAIDDIGGRLRNLNARGSGRIARAAGSKDLLFDGVDVRLGGTRLQLDGSLGERQRDLRFDVEAEDLSLFDAEARGRLSARGRYAGTAEAPLLRLDAEGSDFEWQGNSLAALEADVDIDLVASGRTTGQIELRDLFAAGRRIPRTTLSLTGAPTAQRLRLEIDAAPVRLGMNAQGAMSDGQWRGAIDALGIDDDRDLHLRLEKPARLAFSAQTLDVDELCLAGESARLCAAGQRDPQAWSGAFTAARLPLSALTAGLATDIVYTGTIDIDSEIQGGPGRKKTGELHAQLSDAEVRHRLSNSREERMALGSGRVDAQAVADEFTVSVGLDAGAAGSIRGALTGRRSDAPWETYPIEGSLDLTTDGLGMIDIYFDGIDRASGRLGTKVMIGGTLGAPEIDGLLQLREARIDIYQVNLSLRDLTLDAHFDMNALQLEGQSMLGNGMMKFAGELAWRDREPHGELRIQGENLRIVDVPEALVEASPDLDFKVNGRRIDATGTVRLPRGRLEPADLTNAALASSDEVMVGAPPEDPSRRWTVVSDIRVELGENIEVDAFGLTARLGGAIEVRTDELQNTRGLGELTIVSGDYAAFGRKLVVKRGRLLFNNVSLGDPGVDLRAEKEFPDVIAGVNVRGSLRAPRMTFYSQPSIPQSQIASLILAGGSMESAQDQGATRGYLLAQGGAILAQQYGSKVGIEDVALESDLSNETSLVLGKYLSPRLYVSYGISLAEAINTLKLRYTIDDHWRLKTESGRAQSADLEYTIRR